MTDGDIAHFNMENDLCVFQSENDPENDAQFDIYRR
jgi:hypothetical protein